MVDLDHIIICSFFTIGFIILLVPLSHDTHDYINRWICFFLGFRLSISCGPKSAMVDISLHWVGLKWLKCDRIPKRPNRVLVVSNVHDVLSAVLRLNNHKYNMFLLKKIIITILNNNTYTSIVICHT